MTPIERLAEQLPAFLDHLREDAGFTVGVDQYFAADRLLLALASWSSFPAEPAALKTLLGPVVCKSANEQVLFSKLFDDWLIRLEPAYVAVPEGTLARELGEISRSRTFGLRLLVAVAVAGLFLAASGLYTRRERRKVQEQNQPVLVHPISTEPEARSVNETDDGTAKLNPVSETLPRTTRLLTPTTFIIEGLVVLFAGLIGWRLWWAYRVRRFLAKRPTRSAPDLEHISVAGMRGLLLSDNRLLRLAQRMRTPASVASADLDVRETVLATARRGGVFTPVQGHAQVNPEYLVLVDRTGFQDHQARFFEELIANLTRHEVVGDRYEFDGDPNICHWAGPHDRVATLRDLAVRHPAHRLLIFTSGDGLLDPLSGEPAAWVDLFARWPERALLTPVGLCEWGYRELALARHGFLVVPASEAGLSALADHFNADPSSAPSETRPSEPIPDLVEDRPQRWLERHEPEPEVLGELLNSLKRYLGADGYVWLAACAFYPALSWDLTLYLGYTLESSSGQRILDPTLLLSLARLPWFRHGSMPDWLRTALINSLTPIQAAAIRESLQLLLVSAVQGEGHAFNLEVARGNRGVIAPLAHSLVRHLRAKAPVDSPFRDYVFARGLLGRGPSRLAVEVPRVVRAQISGTARGLVGPALGALAAPASSAIFGASGSGTRPSAETGTRSFGINRSVVVTGLLVSALAVIGGFIVYCLYPPSRGHTFQMSQPIKVVLEPLKDIIYVTLRPDRQSVLNGARDQFRLHPGEGYIHYNEDLKYEIGLTNVTNTNQDVFLETKLEQDPESEHYASVKLQSKETKLGVIKDLVRGVDLKELGQKALRSREVDLGRPRHLDITVWDNPARGRRLTTRRVRFTHLDVGAYAAMGQIYFDAGTQRVTLAVRHLGTDPGKGFIENVIASIDHLSQPATVQGDSLGPPTKITKNDSYVFWFGVDPKTPKVTWSVNVGKKSNAFAGTLAISAGGDEKEKEKEKGAEPPKE